VSLYTLFLVDRSEVLTNKGMVTLEIRLLKMTILGGYTEEIQFDLVTIGFHMVILEIL
jgi:hypothetical protein